MLLKVYNAYNPYHFGLAEEPYSYSITALLAQHLKC